MMTSPSSSYVKTAHKTRQIMNRLIDTFIENKVMLRALDESECCSSLDFIFDTLQEYGSSHGQCMLASCRKSKLLTKMADSSNISQVSSSMTIDKSMTSAGNMGTISSVKEEEEKEKEKEKKKKKKKKND